MPETRGRDLKLRRTPDPRAAPLVAATVPVRALSRSADRAVALTGPGVEAVAASVDDPDALRAAFDGVEAAYLVGRSSTPGTSPRWRPRR